MKVIRSLLTRSSGVILLLACMGCSLLELPTPVAWALTRTPEVSPQTPVLSPLKLKPTATPRPLSTEESSLPGGNSFWLVYSHRDGRTLAALAPGAAQALPIDLPAPLFSASDLRAGASPLSEPGGGWLAVRTRTPLTLRLIHLPDGISLEISRLLSTALEKQFEAARPGDVLPDPVTAVTAADSLSWSPNGRYLAFIAAFEGPSADLYVFDLQTHATQRLTRGSNQAMTLFWSPESNWILTQEVKSFSGGDGWQVTALWAAAVDHTEFRRLEIPEVPAGAHSERNEHFLGWLDASTLAVGSESTVGIHNIRILPLNTRWARIAYAGPCSSVAFDLLKQWVYFTQNAASGAEARLAPGLYRIAAEGSPPELLFAGEWKQVFWHERSNLMIARGAMGVLFIDQNASQRLIRKESNALPSPDGRWIAGWGDQQTDLSNGVRLYQADGTFLQTLSPAAVQWLTWTADAAGLYFQSADTLYYAAFPNPEAQAVAADVLSMGAGLVPALAPSMQTGTSWLH